MTIQRVGTRVGLICLLGFALFPMTERLYAQDKLGDCTFVPSGDQTEEDAQDVLEWDDRCNHFQIVAGVEQSGLSSLPNQTNFFLSAFTRVSGNKNNYFAVRPWARIRLLGAPTGSTGDVVAAFQDPSGALKSLPNSKIGQAADFVAGVEYSPWFKNKDRYSVTFLLEGGATTPLSSQDVVDKFQVPPASSQQCQLLVDQFSPKNGYPANLITRNPDATSPQCLANGITVIAFNSQQRDSFLRKYGAGIRTTYRFLDKTETTDADNNKTTTYTCCEYGMVDVTLGQDEAVTGGRLRRFIVRIDAMHPLWYNAWLYLFGTAAIRLQHNDFQQTLILKADSSGAVPSDPNVALIPLKQPNKDFYRIGIGMNFTKLIDAIKKK